METASAPCHFPCSAILRVTMHPSLPFAADDSSRPKTAARVLLDGAADLEFDYAVPPGMEPSLAVGSRVLAPLQKRTMTGTVLSVQPAGQTEVRQLRPLAKLYDERPLITPGLIKLGQWV